MKTMDRYIGVSAIRGFALVLLLLVILISFLELLAEFNDVGKKGYEMADAFAYIALTIPRRMVELMPFSALLGSILALGVLADHNELIAMQAGGMSVRRICLAVLGASILLMAAALVVAEFIAPPLDQKARVQRSQALYGSNVLLTKEGFWVRKMHSHIFVGRALSRREVKQIEIYEHDSQGRLLKFIYSPKARISKDRQWRLENVLLKNIADRTISSERLNSYVLDDFLSPKQVGVLKLPPGSLSISDLARYIEALRQRGQNTASYELAFWQKISLPLTNGVMVLMALTFIFGANRAATTGRRIIMGAIVGLLFYLANQVFGQAGLKLNLPAAAATLLPVLIILSAALFLLRRVAYR
jgi:lipopolysaccharide export system permease protein